jgi:hypothetical protein
MQGPLQIKKRQAASITQRNWHFQDPVALAEVIVPQVGKIFDSSMDVVFHRAYVLYTHGPTGGCGFPKLHYPDRFPPAPFIVDVSQIRFVPPITTIGVKVLAECGHRRPEIIPVIRLSAYFSKPCAS